MKRIMLALFLFSPLAIAQNTDHEEMCKSIKYYSPTFALSRGYRDIDTFKLLWTRPAKFPNPEKTVDVPPNTPVDCPTFSMVHDKNRLTVTATSMDELAKRGASSLFIATSSGYKYPAIKEDFYFYGISLNLNPIALNTLLAPVPLSGLVAGYKVNGGEFKPLVFQGKYYPIEYTMGDTVELFMEGTTYSNVQYVKVDTAKNQLIMEMTRPFPQN